MAKRPSKYRNVKTVVDGITFASKREATAYQTLRLMERAGRVSHVQTQVAFEIRANGRKICTYIADFTYWDKDKKEQVVADAKGYRTEVYRLKKKLMSVIRGIEIVEL